MQLTSPLAMDTPEILARMEAIVTEAGYAPAQLSEANFLDASDFVRDIVSAWPKTKIERTPWLFDFVESLRWLRDRFSDEVAADPMCLYKPAHSVSMAFHRSLAKLRYFRAGNRTSKTQSGVKEHHWILTGSHPYRPYTKPPAATYIIGSNYAHYSTKVFEPKYLFGEPGNPLSPVFPVGGKWFHSYDSQKHIIYTCCPQCALKRQAMQCSHTKSSLKLFSDEGDPQDLAGGQYNAGQFDEEIDYIFFAEAYQRLLTVPNSSFFVTGTPLGGEIRWEHQELTLKAEAGYKYPGTDIPLVELFTISQYDAGLVPLAEIEAAKLVMAATEFEARILGKPAPFAENAVFDPHAISIMREECRVPDRVSLKFVGEDVYKLGATARDLAKKATPSTTILAEPNQHSFLRVWEPPQPGAIYIAGADVAQGLTGGDFSCADVLKVTRLGLDLCFEQVAQFHGHINSIPYAIELIKLCLWYNNALLGPERRGPGDATLQELKEVGYWNIFRDLSDLTQVDFNPNSLLGIDTNVRTKSVIISSLKSYIDDRKHGKRSFIVRSVESINELGTYKQELSESKQSFKFKASGRNKDDRVMSLAIAVYMARLYPDMDFDRLRANIEKDPYAQLDQMSADIWRDVDEEQRLRALQAQEEEDHEF